MWAGILEICKSNMPQLVMAILTPIAGTIGAMAGFLLKENIERLKDSRYRALAKTAVRWVEQKFKDLDNQQKFDKAYEYLASKLGKSVTKNDIEVLIEEACKNLKIELGNSVSSTTA